MAVTNTSLQSISRQHVEQQPPGYILQSWRREQANIRDYHLLRQTFLIAPDTVIPSSKLRQHIKNTYDERIRSTIVVHYDPWTKEGFMAARAKTAVPKDSSTNANIMRSHTTL